MNMHERHTAEDKRNEYKKKLFYLHASSVNTQHVDI